jgi:hypothetical protein
MPAQSITLRHASTADERALRDLAALDSQRLPAGPLLVAEVDGELRSAISLSDGAVVADPFRHTAHLVELMRAHAASQASSARRAPQAGRRRRPRLAFGL